MDKAIGIESMSYANSWGAPKETKGKRITFALCMSNQGCKGHPYKYGKIPAVKIDTKQNDCPSCKCALFWVTERK